MPHTITWEPDGLYRKFTGEISGDEILESNYELHTDPDFKNIKYIINDFTEISGHSIEVSYTKAYAISDNVISAIRGSLKVALVAIQDDHVELANDYRNQMEGKKFECEIFKRIEDARKWVKY